MKRRLRIAVSVFFALVAVAFAALWAYALGRFESVWRLGTNSSVTIVAIDQGILSMTHSTGGAERPTVTRWEWWGYPVSSLPPAYANRIPESLWRQFRFQNSATTFHTSFPIWLPMAACALVAAFASAPWSRRFSLRTMLIATTLVAIVLGLAVWAGR
jgi:hypothetical protein